MAMATVQQCRPPLLSYNALCSGYGECLPSGPNGTYCSCLPNFGGQGYFFDLSAYGFSFLAALFGLYRLVTLGKISFTSPESPSQYFLRVRTLQRIVGIILTSAVLIFVHASFVLFGQLYPGNSLVCNVFFCLLLCSAMIDSYSRAMYFIDLNLKSTMLFGFEGTYRKFNLAIGLTTALACFVQITTMIPQAFGDADWKLAWHRAFNISIGAVNVLWMVVNWMTWYGIVKALTSNLADLEKHHQEMVDVAKLHEARAKSVRSWYNTVFAAAFPMMAGTLCAVFLNGSAYYVPSAFIIYSVNMAQFLKDVSPPPASLESSK